MLRRIPRHARPPLALAVLVSLCLLLPAPASADRPVRGARYVDRSIGETGELELKVSKRGTSMSVVPLFVAARCSNGREYLPDSWMGARLSIRRDGSFSGVVGEDLRGQAFTRSSSIAVQGRFHGSGRRSVARGTVRVEAVGEGGATCDSGGLNFKARIRR